MPAPSSFNSASPTIDLLQAVISIAVEASATIMQVYGGEFAVEQKQDESPLTQADRQAHHIITQRLQALTPTIPVLSEESSAEYQAFTVRSQWKTLWLVDPLDGTREFINRNGEFTVNIALIHEHRPVLGVVSVPATQTIYSGALGLGAQRMDSHGACSIQTQRPARSLPIVVGSRSHRGDSLDAMLTRLGPHELYAVGSALKFCRLAEGAADFYPRLGPTSEWDTAAGQAVVEAAGGHVFDLQGAPLRYNQRETLLNPNFMAIGDPAFAWSTLLT